MREYNEIMLRPVLYPGGQVHEDPARRPQRARQAAAKADAPVRGLRAQAVLVGCALLVLLVVL